MIRWFAELPIERKLRVVIIVPAIAVFAVAMIAHIAMNLLHLRDDLLWSAARVARATGAPTIEALRVGDDAAALKAMNGLRDEWLVSDAEVLAPNGRALAVYLRSEKAARLETATVQDSVLAHAVPPTDPQHPRLYVQGSRFHIIAAVVRKDQVTGFIHILVPIEVMYPDWSGYILITLAAIVAAVLTAYWLAARLQQQISGPDRELGADHAARVQRGGLQLCGSSANVARRNRFTHRRFQSDARDKFAIATRVWRSIVNSWSNRSPTAPRISAMPTAICRWPSPKQIERRMWPSGRAAPRASSWRA